MRTLTLVLLAIVAWCALDAATSSTPGATSPAPVVSAAPQSLQERFAAQQAERASTGAMADAAREVAARGGEYVSPHTSTAVCSTDSDCAAYDRAHGYVSDGTPGGTRTPVGCEEDEPCWDARTMGNGQAGVGSEHGPRGGRCESGGTYLVNAAGRAVCDYN